MWRRTSCCKAQHPSQGGRILQGEGKKSIYTTDPDGHIGCSDSDFHVPKQRVEQSAEVLQRMDGAVTMRLYPRMGHTINRDELRIAQFMVAALAK